MSFFLEPTPIGSRPYVRRHCVCRRPRLKWRIGCSPTRAGGEMCAHHTLCCPPCCPPRRWHFKLPRQHATLDPGLLDSSTLDGWMCSMSQGLTPGNGRIRWSVSCALSAARWITTKEKKNKNKNGGCAGRDNHRGGDFRGRLASSAAGLVVMVSSS